MPDKAAPARPPLIDWERPRPDDRPHYYWSVGESEMARLAAGEVPERVQRAALAQILFGESR